MRIIFQAKIGVWRNLANYEFASGQPTMIERRSRRAIHNTHVAMILARSRTPVTLKLYSFSLIDSHTHLIVSADLERLCVTKSDGVSESFQSYINCKLQLENGNINENTCQYVTSLIGFMIPFYMKT